MISMHVAVHTLTTAKIKTIAVAEEELGIPCTL